MSTEPRPPVEHVPDTRCVEAEVVARATPREAWEAWAEAEKIAGWFVDRADRDAAPGETVTWSFDAFDAHTPYRVLDSVPGERLVLGPASDDSPPFVLAVDFDEAGDGTRIRLVNSGFSPDADFDAQFEGIESGWILALAVLKWYLERHFGKEKRTILEIRPVDASAERVRTAFTDPGAQEEWLAEGSGVGAVGEPVRLDLGEAGTVTGVVLARSDTEVALGWEETGGVLELKSFAAGPRRSVGVRATLWDVAEETAERLGTRLSEVVDALAEALGG